MFSGVPQRAAGVARHQTERVGLDGDGFLVGDVSQPVEDRLTGQASEVVALAAGDDGGQDVVRLGSAEDEDDVLWGFLQGFEEGVGRLGGEHVGFVDDVDLASALGRHEVDPVTDVANLVNAPVAGGVQLDDVHVAAIVDGDAKVALVARVSLLRVGAIDRFGQYAGGGGFARAAWPAEQVAVANPVLHDGLTQGVGYMLLPSQVAKAAGSPFTVVHLRGHIGDGHPGRCRRFAGRGDWWLI